MNELFRKAIKIIPFVIAFGYILTFHYHAEVHRRATKATVSTVDNIEAAYIYKSLEKYLKNSTNTAIKKALPYVLEFAEKINVSGECMKNSLHLMNGLRSIKLWAFRFLDASGKLPDGLMYGSVTALGDYQQCLDIEVKSTRKKDLGEKLYQGQYCMIEAKPTFVVKKPIAQKMHEFPEEFNKVLNSDSIFALVASKVYYMELGGIRVGACIPSGCTREDVNGVLKLVGQMYLKALQVNVTALRCEKKEANTYTPAQISVLTFYFLICFLALAGSIADIYCPDTTLVKSKATRALLAFSFVTNFRKFCSAKQASDSVTCLNGMKFFGLTWVVIGHTFLAGLNLYTHGLAKFIEYPERFGFQAVVNAMFAVDTFFVIGSFLVAYLTTKHIILQKKKFNVMMYIIHRLLRLYPTYITLFTVIVIIPLMNSGPLWVDVTDFHLGPCYENWWANLLFINNFYHAKEQCLLHTWYITIDIQLYIIALIFLIPLIRWPKIGLSMIFVGIIVHILYCGIMTYVYEFPPDALVTLMGIDESKELWTKIYFQPISHLGPYGIGILLGYFYAMNPDFKMSRLTQILGWCVAFTCSFSVLYGTRGWYIRTVPQYLAVIYAALCRTAWSLGPAWIILCCATGHGGILNWILSWKIFIYLGRLTYAAYLIHVIPMIIFLAGVKERIQIDLFMFIWIFFGAVGLCLTFGFILHMLIEVPFANLERVFLLEPRKKPESAEKENNVVHNGLKHEMTCDIILMPSEKDSSTRL